MPLAEYAYVCSGCYVTEYDSCADIDYVPDVPRGSCCVQCGKDLPESVEDELRGQVTLLNRRLLELSADLASKLDPDPTSLPAEIYTDRYVYRRCDPGDCGCAGRCNQDDDPFGTFS